MSKEIDLAEQTKMLSNLRNSLQGAADAVNAYLEFLGKQHFPEQPKQVTPFPQKPLEKPSSTVIPDFDPNVFINHEWKDGLIDQNDRSKGYKKGSLSFGWDHPDRFPESAIAILRKGPLEIDEYIIKLSENGRMVQTSKAKTK